MSDVISAAKRLRANEYKEPSGWRERIDDRATIASAALAEGMFREDDGEAVTHSQCVAMIDEAVPDDYRLAIALYDIVDTGRITTRGQLRSLLAALGIVKGAE